jgi:hypothetical protein
VLFISAGGIRAQTPLIINEQSIKVEIKCTLLLKHSTQPHNSGVPTVILVCDNFKENTKYKIKVFEFGL